MSANKHLIALAITTALTVGQSAVAQEPGEDSAYQWGRWAVLSPAAGGEPFRAPDDPSAQFNARPGDASEFQPEIQAQVIPPPVVPVPPVLTDPRDRLPPRPPVVATDPRDRLPPR